jgi:hypothetical protein
MKKIILAALISVFATCLFTAIIHNVDVIIGIVFHRVYEFSRSKQLIALFFFYLLLYLSLFKWLKVPHKILIPVVFLPSALIDASVLFTYPEMVPLRFPFCTKKLLFYHCSPV